MALGAFMIDAIIAEACELKRIERLIVPVRDMFSAIFFVATGLLGTGTLALPFLIATYRKLKALGMLLAELGVPESRAGRHTPKVRAVLAEMFPVLSLLLMFLLISALSSSLLPPVELLVAGRGGRSAAGRAAVAADGGAACAPAGGAPGKFQPLRR